ncbi:MAG: wax ester/triacylglycerol synthase family O-acyltransferase [Deltaproteobacteria bacterium]|nr:wax ester/triacylglycerol synthase family O-acyltransferase [Deltaproteobacteria bacterium]MBW2219497.1 wax ester/triacylglycerol synthase family O-acyltransferase [Deltaproteobacteria bacterium]
MSVPMTNVDNFWLCMDDPSNLMIITAFMEFEEPLDFNRLYATVENRLATFDRFKKRVVRPKSKVGMPRWETDKNYDLRSHLHRVALPAPGDKSDLQEMIGNLMTTDFDHNKPLWQIHLIENYGKGCVLFFRIHHCIADGIALIHVLLSTTDTDPNAPWPESSKSEKKKSRSKIGPMFSFNTVMDSVRDTVKTSQKLSAKMFKEIEKYSSDPKKLTKILKTSASLPVEFASVLAKHTIMKSDPNTAFKGKLGVRKHVAWTEPMSLDKIKKVGRAINTATLNDVLIATVTGAMRRYLETRNTSVNELDLRVTIPVNIRKPGTEFELGNKFSLVFLALPVYLKDPILRLKEVKRRMDKLKKSPDPYINFGLVHAIGHLPPSLAQKAAQLFGNKASGVMTNVPGPRQPLYFSGKKISNIMVWVPRSGAIGLGIGILSYDGKVSVGIASDAGLMPDPEVLLEGFEDEFNELLDLVQSGKIYDEPLVLHDRYKEARSIKKEGKKKDKKEKITDASDPGRCIAHTKTGKRCSKKALENSEYCHVHQHLHEEDTVLHDVAQIMKELTG